MEEKKKLVAKEQLASAQRASYWKNFYKSRVFEQNTDIIKFWLFYSVTLLNWGNLQREVGGKFT